MLRHALVALVVHASLVGSPTGFGVAHMWHLVVTIHLAAVHDVPHVLRLTQGGKNVAAGTLKFVYHTQATFRKIITD